MTIPALRVEHIEKSFGSNRVLEDITFDAFPGEIHALVGENGAGKSTLMNIIGGTHQPDQGHIFRDGENCSLPSPSVAIAKGISTVHQEFSLVPNLSVAQNMFANQVPTRLGGLIDWKTLYQRAKQVLDPIGIPVNPKTLVGKLSIGMRQMVEIAKSLSLNAKVIIFDEPTSALSETEVKAFYRIVNELKRQQVALVFISHKLEEVFRVSDRISVLRDGRLVSTKLTQETDPQTVVAEMVGRELDDLYPERFHPIGEEVFRVEGLSQEKKFENIHFSIKKGEILGFAGLVGSGRTEVARAIVGADPLDEGKIYLHQKPIKLPNIKSSIDQGVCYLTEDRKELGLFLAMPVRENIVVASLKRFVSKLLVLNKSLIKQKSQDYVNYLKIRPFNDEALMVNLSGGNQQKALLAKWLETKPKVLIVDEPTRGVDIGSKAQIHQELVKLASQGVGIIVISSELPEVLGLSDRVAVFSNGKIAATLKKSEATQERVMHYATYHV